MLPDTQILSKSGFQDTEEEVRELKRKLKHAQEEAEQCRNDLSSETEARLKLGKQVICSISTYAYIFFLFLLAMLFHFEILSFFYLTFSLVMQLESLQAVRNSLVTENRDLKKSLDKAVATSSELAESLRMKESALHTLESTIRRNENEFESSTEGISWLFLADIVFLLFRSFFFANSIGIWMFSS